MGIERWYVAIVDEGPLLTRALADPTFGENLSLPWLFEPDRHGRNHRGFYSEFLAAVDAMNRSHPGIDGRVFTLDRLFDMLHFLLSEERRRGEPDAADLGSKAILGANGLPGHLLGGQGHAIRYSPPAEVGAIAAWLAGQAVEDLRSAYDPGMMLEQHVYKIWGAGDDPQTWDRIAAGFEGFRSLYTDAAARGEGVLAIVT
ncbi:DUF1877 family protein [Paludisphaera mucosa]|uniref:DUF1877 family protein n=1 Tax=Paludisphaera mucosa TaxID=3030827 RepID=A0ABT6FIG0_9BACT|nr:DUF1877 family protein [Paludisphaera mucosa]MDG3007372.1 DUF1877 family protein [Paludisphaera mucosa]